MGPTKTDTIPSFVSVSVFCFLSDLMVTPNTKYLNYLIGLDMMGESLFMGYEAKYFSSCKPEWVTEHILSSPTSLRLRFTVDCLHDYLRCSIASTIVDGLMLQSILSYNDKSANVKVSIFQLKTFL